MKRNRSETRQQGWVHRPRSHKWKLSACLIWLVLCGAAGLAASLGFVLYLGGTDNQPSAQLQASRQFGEAIATGSFIAALSGVVFIARRPKLKSAGSYTR